MAGKYLCNVRQGKKRDHLLLRGRRQGFPVMQPFDGREEEDKDGSLTQVLYYLMLRYTKRYKLYFEGEFNEVANRFAKEFNDKFVLSTEFREEGIALIHDGERILEQFKAGLVAADDARHKNQAMDASMTKVLSLLNRRGQSFLPAQVGDEYRMLQCDTVRGTLAGTEFADRGLAVIVNTKTRAARLYVYHDIKGGFPPNGTMPKPAGMVFELELAGIGHIAAANRLERTLLEMHQIDVTSGIDTVSES